MASDGSPPRSNPSMFNASLFSTPTTSTAGTDGDFSSLGLGDNPFQSGSPFTLAPAAPVGTLNEVSSPPKENRSVEGSIRPFDANQVTELSTVPLDSPPGNQVANNLATLGTVHGWNDPPLLSTFSSQPQPPNELHQNKLSVSEPLLQSTVDTYNVQPLLLRDNSQLTPSASSISATDLPETTSNPYRLGGKKPVINTTPAYDVPPAIASQYTVQAPPVSSYGGTAPPLSTYTGTTPSLTSNTGIAPSLSTYTGATPSLSNYTGTTPSSVPSQEMGSSMSTPSIASVQPHWFYRRADEEYWFPFSVIDSNKLEEAYIRSQADLSIQMIIQTDGGRYDVNLTQRTKIAVYWEEPSCPVRRCTWFFKGDSERWYVPYLEDVASKLEEVFVAAVAYGRWNSRVDLPDGEAVIFHSPTAMVHYPAQHFQPLNHEIDYNPKSVLRGFLERDKVEMGDTRSVDHLVFVVHGIGPFADIRLNSYKSLVDCVDDFREVSHLMLKTHKFAGRAVTDGRVEFLPVHWHAALHGDDTGVDEQVNSITLPSIAKLREFTNSTLIDVLFYTSPLYLQTIVNQVASEMNRMLDIFCQRNPSFSGDVSVMGHSLGSCILFDLLYHQSNAIDLDKPLARASEFTEYNSRDSSITEDSQIEDTEETPTLHTALESLGLSSLIEKFEKEQIDFDSLLMCSNDDLKELGIPMGPRKKLTVSISEWIKKKEEQTKKRAIRQEEKEAREKQAQLMKEQEVDELKDGIQGVKYVRSTVGTGQPLVQYPKLNFEPTFLFALGSPVGLFLTVRGVESLGSEYQLPTCSGVFNIFHPFDPVAYRLEPLVTSSPPTNPLLMPHHKGRKRFHLEIYDNLERVGASVRHHIVEGVRNMWNQLNELARAHTSGGDKDNEGEVVQDDITSQASVDDVSDDTSMPVGMLNGGHRIDHVLQEKPLEKLNQYLFAMSSHLCYWRSEDTALFLLNQVYSDKVVK